MAFPTTLSDIALNGSNRGSCPPFNNGDDIYVVGIDATNLDRVSALKATDPTTSFSEQDTANRPDHTANHSAIAVIKDGTDLHIATQDVNGDVLYHKFSMSSDTWTTTDESVTTTPDGAQGVGIGIRSDGDIIILHQGQQDDSMGLKDRIDYSRKEVSWTTDIAVDNGGSDHWKSPIVVKGSSDRMHFFFENNSKADGSQRTLNSANSLETFPSAYDTSCDATAVPNHSLASYDDGGTQRIRAPYRDKIGGVSDELSLVKFDSADAPTQSVVTDITGATTTRNDSTFPQMSSMVYDSNNSDLWLVFTDGSEADLYSQSSTDNGDTWSSATAEITGIICDELYANIYTRDGNIRIGLVYQDGTNELYNEIDLGAPPAGFTPEFFKRNIIRRRTI